MQSIHHWVAGRERRGESGRSGDVFNSAMGQVTGKVALANAAEVALAVASAQAAFPKWADTPPISRARVMFKFLELLNRSATRWRTRSPPNTARCSPTRKAK
jgi:malonate-semialdehyde dehydrogenase (acetylating) / methylmalonate-semialdehyde dehydrogenase